MNSFNNLPYFFQISYKQIHLLCHLEPTVFNRCIAHVLLEHTVEMLRILETQVVGYLADSLVGSRYHFFGGINRP